MDLSSNRISGQRAANQRAAAQRQQGSINASMSNASSARPSSLSDYGASRYVSSLSEGEIIKGEVSDLRNTEIEVTLENNTHVSAKIEEGASLSIGDTYAFKVTHIEKGEITLKALPKTPLLQEMSTIAKALEEANLPKNDKNISIVRELIAEGLPINRQEIQNTMKLIYQYPDISLSTLLQIKKNELPLNYNQALMLEDLKEGSLSLPAQLDQFSEQFYTLLLKDSPNASEFLSLIKFISSGEDMAYSSISETGTAPSPDHPFYFSSLKDQNDFLDILSNFQETAKLEESINQGTLTLKDAVHAIMDGMGQAMEIDENNRKLALMEENADAKNTAENAAGRTPELINDSEDNTGNAYNNDNVNADGSMNPASKETANSKGIPFFRQLFSLFSQPESQSEAGKSQGSLLVPSTLDLFDHPVIHNILQAYEEQTLAMHNLYHLLTPEELSGLSQVLKETFSDSFPEDMLSKIRYGEITVNELGRELAKQIKQAPFPLDSLKGQMLYSNRVMHKLISKSLFSRSFLTPQDFYQKENIEKNYQKTNSTLNILEHFFNAREHAGSTAQNLLAQAGQIKSSLSFLGTVNDAFQYLQLPLRLKNQNTKGELYVYTKKDALREHPDCLSVLLHLDMENLGPLDVALKMESNRIQAVFTIEDEENKNTYRTTTKEILQNHMDSLKTALEEKGFLLNSRLETRKEFESFSAFMKKSQQGANMKRYSFDIRA